MQNADNTKQIYKRLGGSWNDSGGLLLDVLLQTAHNRAHSKDKGKNVQNLKIRMSNL